MSRVLITGVTGQDGSYLAELLIARGHEVHGTAQNPGEGVTPGVEVHVQDLSEPGVGSIVRDLRPDR